MKTSILSSIFFTTLLSITSIPSGFAAEEAVFGWQLMSQQERNEHQRMMRSFKTEEEREAYRIQHHKQMQERARERGVTLPDEPLQRGQGQGGGRGMGGGTGGGMGGGNR